MVNPMNAVNDNPWIAEEAEAADAAAAENANGEEAAKPGKIKIEREQIKLEKRLCREVGKAILDYNMIEEGDKSWSACPAARTATPCSTFCASCKSVRP
jgi:tRNA 2-thiocytidine biosynthesis protein TtcA